VGDVASTDLAGRLLAWFDARHRDLPWRRTTDPYRILVAEVLLQRTRVATGVPYYERFVGRFPTVEALARASDVEVLRAWEGLGFYRRARNLHAAAKAILERHGGAVPSDPADLDRLPGIGPYTAGAVASVAFGRRAPAVDGNAIRVLARVYRIREDVSAPSVQARIRDLAAALVPVDRPGDFNQALMELGATVCGPAAPACPSCPIEDLCVARREGVERTLPRTAKPRAVPTVPVVFAYVEMRRRVLLVRRPDGGLLAGLWSLPGGERPPAADDRAALRDLVRDQTGLRVRVEEAWATVGHAFSHRRWAGSLYRCVPVGAASAGPGARWADRGDLADLPLVPFHRRALATLASRGPASARREP
jgi:A/G-specific adenine glycosylase